MEGHDAADYFRVFAVRGDVGQALFYDFTDVRLQKSVADAAGHEDAPVDAVAPVGDAGGLLGVSRGKVRIARGHQAPGIDENLPANLLGHGAAVLFDAAGQGRLHAGPEVEIGSVLRGDAIAAPPEEAGFVAGVVQQGIAHVLGGNIVALLAVPQGPQEEQGAVGVVVRRELSVLLRVSSQLSQLGLDSFVGPALYWGAQAHADDLCQPPGVDFFDEFRIHCRHITMLQSFFLLFPHRIAVAFGMFPP